MKKSNIFYSIFISTILLIRIWVYFFPTRKIFVNGVLIHHFWIGIILLFIALLFRKRYNKLVTVLLPISLGIISDQLIYIITGGNTVTEYWGNYSVYGMFIIAIIVLVFRNKIIKYLHE